MTYVYSYIAGFLISFLTIYWHKEFKKVVHTDSLKQYSWEFVCIVASCFSWAVVAFFIYINIESCYNNIRFYFKVTIPLKFIKWQTKRLIRKLNKKY